MYRILTTKDIMQMLHVSEATAKKYKKEMLLHYKPKSKKVTAEHFSDYFAIPRLKR